ncbi:MAG: aminotransferase class V-fold PLP-dependent enzyme [Actinomycetota bacterium]|nr:aminotransferase class V-fold PLP-dependent enzyme [Actinomycetota bacterium]
MDNKGFYILLARVIPPRFLSKVTQYAEKLPPIRKLIDKEYESIAKEVEEMVRPYGERFLTMSELPTEGINHEEIIRQMKEINRLEEPCWKGGYASGAVYHGDQAHIDFLNEVYAINSQSNPLHSDLWPSTVKYEAEIVSMTARMLGGAELSGQGKDEACGVVTSGGTESIMLAMKAYRDWARDKKKITHPEMVVPTTAHAAFDKAAHCFGIKVIHVPVGNDYRADVEVMARAVNRNTIVIVGSAPQFPHGVIDPIEELSKLAMEKKVGFHTDACLGGFVLPWARELGYDIPPFDFRLPGVTSMSADTHKFGFAAKGTSVVLYRSRELMHYQYFKTLEWPGGLYFTPTFAGSRPGALAAVCWAAMLSMGKDGYRDAVKRILDTAAVIKKGIEEISELELLGDPLWVIAFKSNKVDIYNVMEIMASKGWRLNGLQNPPAVHICVTLRHTQDGVAARLLEDLREAVATARDKSGKEPREVAMYSLGATFPDKRLVDRGIDLYLDTLYSTGE